MIIWVAIVAVAYTLVKFGDRFVTSKVRKPIAIAIIAVGMVSSAKAMYTWLTYTGALGYLVGPTSARDYIATYADPSVVTLSQVHAFLDSRGIEPEGRLLMLYEARSLYFDIPTIQDTRATNLPLLAAVLDPGDCLDSMGVTHVLVGSGSMRYYSSRGADPSVFRWPRFVEFAESCLGGEPIFDGAAHLLFERSPPAETTS